MSGMILCRTKESQVPLHIDSMDINIYSLEELSYYIYNNIYVIEMDMIDDRLLKFIKEDVGEYALADRIEYLMQNGGGLAQIVVTILKYVDYYNDEEIDEIKDILETLNTQKVYERLKSRADSYLNNKFYYKAIITYQKILDGNIDTSLSGLFYANVNNNIGVAYARMFLFEQAAFYFKEAYRIGQHDEYKKAYMMAERMAKGSNIIEDDDAGKEELAVRKAIETSESNAVYSDEYGQLESTFKKKDEGHVAEYYNQIEALIELWKQNYRKYTS